MLKCIEYIHQKKSISLDANIKNRENKFTHTEKKDIHERDSKHLEESYNAACSLVEKYNWNEVKCVKNEEIRTRAYDAKLSNGMIGMIMYITLVFMAIKYTFIYLKRMLTIMVLTLMAPGVGVAYALQRVMTGKSQALKLWMTDSIRVLF